MRNWLMLIILLLSFNTVFTQDWTKNLSREKKKKGTLNFYEVQDAFYQAYPKDIITDGKCLVKGEKKKIHGWKQFKRWEWYWENRVDKITGEFPDRKVLDGLLQRKNRSVIDGGGNWTNLGPSDCQGGYAGLGRVNCIAFHPTDQYTYWVGTPAGGVWKTTDEGGTWTVLTDNNNVLGVSSIVLSNDFTTDNTIFIGTGDRDGGSCWTLGGDQNHDNNGVGILKSTDGGQTWEPTGLTFLISDQKVVNKILINPTNNQEMLAATSNGMYKSIDGGDSWIKEINNGNWIDMEYKPTDPSTIYASTKGWSSSFIYISTDGGSSWQQAYSTGGVRTELAVSPDEPTWVYALTANSDSGLDAIYKSEDSGLNFSAVFTGGQDNALLNSSCDGTGENSGQGSYDLCIAADPNNAEVVYLGGVNTWKSTNGGADWDIITHWYSSCSGITSVTHADKHCLEFQNGTSVLFEGNDGGLYKTDSDGESWSFIGSGLSIGQIYRLGVSQTDGDAVICGLQDNGTKLAYNDNWYDVKGGDGMECIIDYTNSDIQYGSYVNGQISRTNNLWESSTDISANINTQTYGAWVTPYIIDPVDHQTLYVGYNDVWKTTDKGNSWIQISNIDFDYKIRSMAIAPSDNQVLYIADHNDLWKTTNGGDNWTNTTNNLPTNTSNITYIAVKGDDPNTLWVTFGGYNNTCVYQSVNGGDSWTNISGGLPSIPVMSIVQNIENTQVIELFVGTDVGVYHKEGDGSWTPYCTNLPNVLVTELEIYYASNPNDTRLRAATFGRGLWETPIMEVVVEEPVAEFSANSTIVCAGSSVSFTDESTGYPTSWLWNYGNGGALSTQANPMKMFSVPGTYTITLTVQNNQGTSTMVKEDYITVVASANSGYNGQLTVCEGTTPTEDELFEALAGYPSTGGTWTHSGLEYTYTVAGTPPCVDKSSVVTVTEKPAPEASFTINTDSEPIIDFTNTSSNADDNTWNMGDGTVYTTVNTTHTYDANGTYTVVLESSNECGTNQAQENIQITNVGIILINGEKIRVYPNPTESLLHIDLPEENVKISLVSISGKTVIKKQTESEKTIFLYMGDLKSGSYNLVLDFKNNKREVIKVIKK